MKEVNEETKTLGCFLMMVLGGIIITIVSVLLWWFLAGPFQSRQYEINTHSQQWQAAKVSELRNTVQAYNAATDESQKTALANTFCAEYTELNPPTADLQDAHSLICN